MNYTYMPERRLGGAQILLIIALCFGIVGGSLYLISVWSGNGAEIKEYLSAAIAAAGENTDRTAVFRSSLVSSLISLAVIFVMGFFRLGFLGTGAVIIRRGFITGYTSASFLSAYGAKGTLAMLASSPSSLITAAAMLLFSAASVSFSLNENKFQKKFIFSYIFFAIITFSIFCAASFAEGFLTTTFMKWLIPNLS